MLQLELGVLPMSKDLKEGLYVAFFVNGYRKNKKKISARHGRIVSMSGNRVVIEDIACPGSRYNRHVDQIFEVHKNTSLQEFL